MSTKMMSLIGFVAMAVGVALLLTVIPMTLHNAAAIAAGAFLIHFGAYQRFLSRVPGMLAKAKEIVK